MLFRQLFLFSNSIVSLAFLCSSMTLYDKVAIVLTSGSCLMHEIGTDSVVIRQSVSVPLMESILIVPSGLMAAILR